LTGKFWPEHSVNAKWLSNVSWRDALVIGVPV
jgi:hypothetical protein